MGERIIPRKGHHGWKDRKKKWRNTDKHYCPEGRDCDYCRKTRQFNTEKWRGNDKATTYEQCD